MNRKIIQIYTHTLSHVTPKKNGFGSEHIAWMLKEMKSWPSDSDEGKFNRWLGFVQGWFWTNNLLSIDEMRGHARANLPALNGELSNDTSIDKTS